MSQDVAQIETDGLWLPLTEYSVRSGVSLSTIRRKIKSNAIPYKLEKGRYLIFFGSGETVTPPVVSVPKVASPAKSWDGLNAPEPKLEKKPAPILSAEAPAETVRMITDAFEHALKEKDQHIRLLEKRNQDLEERLQELRLLVQVLEEKYDVRY